jgi:hypothetical protein
LPENKLLNTDDIFSKQFKAAKSINDLLDLVTITNLSRNNALKLISHITNQINSGKSQLPNIETDDRFICLQKILKANDKINVGTKQLPNDLLQYSELSTPAMIEARDFISINYVLNIHIYI